MGWTFKKELTNVTSLFFYLPINLTIPTQFLTIRFFST